MWVGRCVCARLCVSCSEYTFSSAFWCHISTPYTICVYILYWYCGQIQWISSFSISSIEFDAASKLLFRIMVFLLSSIPSLILPHYSPFFIKIAYTFVCVYGMKMANKPKIKRKNRNHTHTRTQTESNSKMTILLLEKEHQVLNRLKTLSSPLLSWSSSSLSSASSTPHIIHTHTHWSMV